MTVSTSLAGAGGKAASGSSASAPAFVRGAHLGADERLATQADQVTGNASLDNIDLQMADVKTATETVAASVASNTPHNSISVISATVKSGAGVLYSIMARNRGATALYLWLFDSLSASGTILWQPVLIPAGQQIGFGSEVWPNGITATTGITFGFSSTELTYTAHVTATDCHFSASYK